MKLDKAIDWLSVGETDSEMVAEDCARKYGIGADEVLEEKERRIKVLERLKVVAEALCEAQREVLFLYGAGYRQEEIARIRKRDPAVILRTLRSIPDRLQAEADPEKIDMLVCEVERLSKTSRGRHSKLYADLSEELRKKRLLQETLQELPSLLAAPQSKKEMDGKLSMPAYTFERVMQIGEGMREGIQDGRKVMKTIVKCRLPEYVSEAFGDAYTCCTLCATCSRKKDVAGRAGYDKYGLEKPSQF